MNTPKQALHKDKEALNRVAEYVANPMFEQVLLLAFNEYAFTIGNPEQAAANDLKRQGAKGFIMTAMALGRVEQPPKTRPPEGLRPMPGDPGFEDFMKQYLRPPVPTQKPA